MKSSDHFFVRKTQCTDHFHFLFELLTKKELKLLLSCIIKLESSQKIRFTNLYYSLSRTFRLFGLWAQVPFNEYLNRNLWNVSLSIPISSSPIRAEICSGKFAFMLLTLLKIKLKIYLFALCRKCERVTIEKLAVVI